MTALNKQALRERYSPKPVPKCHICGEEMTIQRISASRITYGCTGEGNDGYFKFGRTFADEHYEKSRVTVVDVSDPDVLALLDENLQLQREKDATEAVALALRDDMQQARERLAAAEQERENWRISFDNERYRADKLAAALNAEREKLVMANRSLITQHTRANSAESRIAELEARTVCLPKLPVLGSTAERYEGFAD
ncbi:ead/Ea22-like family protein, partial [Salmonella enterica subsp. enterica serovar Mbandaka]|nr:ead/Ea22-like family protein [Salmonella enterica subsp. enterica serovar Mbandaka]ECP0247487.1 ead/Ea22-like family protein [Salmonella enterica]EBV9047053.1 ead/Ea22-like family protein [Salmonella enterica subsp. enterica serovar Mbandaka]EBX0491177.1 ead/Ea22-like family protein [Salmonella enterica subsp. enterica serovar Mbandaka]ECE2890472.1 ead/Ea22-like family protein [Salmonella enterica subsp. enterica serovar Mbandaka]